MGFIVGVTGGIGSGKSAVTERFEEHGITVVDADLASRVIVQPGKPALKKIAAHFGQEILLQDGSLDRASLRQQVFAKESERKWLEALTHPLISEEIVAQLAASRSPFTILSSPLLLETSQKHLAQRIVVVDAPEAIQLSRAMARDGNDEAQVRRIMAAQMGREERLSHAHFVIDNAGSLEDLDKTVAKMLPELLHLAASH
jgi:dephospho-CoA kinase